MKKDEEMVKVEFSHKSDKSFLSFSGLISMAEAGRIMTRLATLSENDYRPLKAPTLPSKDPLS